MQLYFNFWDILILYGQNTTTETSKHQTMRGQTVQLKLCKPLGLHEQYGHKYVFIV